MVIFWWWLEQLGWRLRFRQFSVVHSVVILTQFLVPDNCGHRKPKVEGIFLPVDKRSDIEAEITEHEHVEARLQEEVPPLPGLPRCRHLDPLILHVVASAGVFGPDALELLLHEGQNVLVFFDPLMDLKLHSSEFFGEGAYREGGKAKLFLGHIVENHVLDQLIVAAQIQLIPTSGGGDPVLNVGAAV